MTGAAAALRGEIRREGGLLAAAVRDADPSMAVLAPAESPCEGPRTSAAPAEYEFVLEAIREGCRVHYGSGRVVAPEDPDLALLAGDQLYALGLSRLASLGDVEAVEELADVISLCAQAHAEGDAERAAAVWEAGIAAVGWGGSPALEEAKALARAGDPGATQALRAAARRARAQVPPPR